MNNTHWMRGPSDKKLFERAMEMLGYEKTPPKPTGHVLIGDKLIPTYGKKE